MRNDKVLMQDIPYRLKAISTMTIALRWWPDNDAAEPMKIYFGDRLVVKSNSYGFLNPVIECGLLHCRVLLEFLGLCEAGGQLQNVNHRHGDDIRIEQLANAAGPLPKVTPTAAIARYAGDHRDAERAMLAIFHATNKGLAHLTSGLDVSKSDARLIEIASKHIPSLVINYLYTPLGLPPPDFDVSSRHGTSP